MGEYPSLPTYDPYSERLWQVDLRSYDLTRLDLSGSMDALRYADFDSGTLWPSAERMPEGFDWQRIMETGKNPGLGIRKLHEAGITGKGVGIAIIDQTLLVDHQEYVDRIQFYEETDNITGYLLNPLMHGAAVASIAVGKTTGVAPDADLYFIADWIGDNQNNLDFTKLAGSIDRIIQVNASLPEGRKIRVISLSIGWDKSEKGFDAVEAAVQRAKDANIFVISSNLGLDYGLWFQGLGRDPLSDPDLFGSYTTGLFWEDSFYAGKSMEGRLLVPMDSRTTASPNGVDKYVFYREGGWSWSIPYIAGMYALAVQVKPDITPDEFWATALQTGTTIQVQKDGKSYDLGPILNPQALIDALK